MADQVRVFVSHHHSPEEDKFTARLVKDLEVAGADVWVDSQEITANPFPQRISEGLERSQWLVLVMTPQSVASPWVRNEVFTALSEYTSGRMLGVIPIVAEATAEQDIPMLWRPLHRYDATNTYEAARDDLMHAFGLAMPLASSNTSHSHPASALVVEPQSRYPLPIVPARLASLGFRGVNVNGTPAIIPPLITVPAGSFLMGSDQFDAGARDDEKPRRRVEVAEFHIGKFPVTVAEYALFPEARRIRERFPYADPIWSQQLENPDHPVVNISWYDADDYVIWLRKVTGQANWRLLSDEQWEKAARWDAVQAVSRRYPWGNVFDKDRCNTSESGIGTTTPVGSYPGIDERRSGASPWGVEDMAGNVREWTSTWWENPENRLADQFLDGLTLYAYLRGGSWTHGAQVARAAHRDHDDCGTRDSATGFRLALALETDERDR